MVFRELFYVLPRRGNAIIFLKFEDTARKTVFLSIILPLLQAQGTFVLKFSLKKLPVKNFSFHGCLFKIVHAHFFFHGLKSAQLITPGFTPNFDVQIDHGLIFASRALFCELITGGK